MRVLLQRVKEAWVRVANQEIARIGKGYLLLVGIATDDTEEEARWLAKKVLQVRLFPDEQGKMNRSIQEVGGALLVVSQFTLYGMLHKGTRPTFHRAAPAQSAHHLYRIFVDALRTGDVPVLEGKFGAYMEVGLINDGPVTLLIEREPKPQNP